MDEIENIDGYVSKDNLYRLLSNFRMRNVLTEEETDLLRKITVAIKDMPNEKNMKHGQLIDLPRALDPSERPVKCSVCGTVTSLYHGYTPRYCSDCGAKYSEED